jgi:cellulose synthase (UDP-forming)
MIAPMIFLIIRQPFLKLDPLIYALAYIPYFFTSVLIFIISVRQHEYGLKGFLLHQANEYLAFTGITLALFSYLFRRKVPFKVTPKGKSMKNLRILVPHLAFLILLIVSIIEGLLWLSYAQELNLLYSIYINLFWASWHILFLTLAILSSLSLNINDKVKYLSFNY